MSCAATTSKCWVVIIASLIKVDLFVHVGLSWVVCLSCLVAAVVVVVVAVDFDNEMRLKTHQRAHNDNIKREAMREIGKW